MKNSCNLKRKGKVILMSEVKPGMVFYILNWEGTKRVNKWLFWCDSQHGICTQCGSGLGGIGAVGSSGHDHWKDHSNMVEVVISFYHRAVLPSNNL